MVNGIPIILLFIVTNIRVCFKDLNWIVNNALAFLLTLLWYMCVDNNYSNTIRDVLATLRRIVVSMNFT